MFMDNKIEMNKFKTIKISPELHNIIKKYCNDNNYKMNGWIENKLKKIMISLDEKNN